ncbi:hypothetical protein BH24ACT8_BH24ACT8_15140 [soil metagenome]
MNETFVTVAGNLTQDPQLKFGRESGVPFAVFRVAQNRQRWDKEAGQLIQIGTNFVDVIAFRALGINVVECAKKGDPVVVHGRLRIDQWTNGDKSGTTVQVDAGTVGFDLTFGQAEFRRVRRPQVPGADRLDDVEVADSIVGHDAGRAAPDGPPSEEPSSLPEEHVA